MKGIICIGGRCSTWGQSWKKHLYDGGEICLRCGMDRKEQFEEDKLANLVTGKYIPNTGKPRSDRPVISRRVMYCALGEEGIEYVSETLRGCKSWISDRVNNENTEPDYYSIVKHTKAELAAMPEV